MRKSYVMNDSTRPIYLHLIAALSLSLALVSTCVAAQADTAAEEEAVHKAVAIETAAAGNFALQIAEQEAQVAEAQRQIEEASLAMAEAARALEEARESKNVDMERSRAELSRAHRALREASREIAMAHREAELGRRYSTRIHTINMGDRAVIGVLLGEPSDRGVILSGVSPGGPAEQAGLKKGDLITSIRETDLTDLEGDEAREALVETMSEVKAGEEIRIGFIRDGKQDSLMVKAEQREPSSWQSFISLPEPPPPPPHPPGAPGAPQAPAPPDTKVWVAKDGVQHIIVDRTESNEGGKKVVVIDVDNQTDRIAEIENRMDSFQYMFIDEEGNRIGFDEEFRIDDEHFSDIGTQAFNQADMWFGLSHTSGLELASLNPGLGEYFKTDRGVLVLNVKADNSYGLQSGDVILSVAGDDVNTPAELIRILRNFEPGAEFELKIKRDRRDKVLQAVLPDSRLGALINFGSPLGLFTNP